MVSPLPRSLLLRVVDTCWCPPAPGSSTTRSRAATRIAGPPWLCSGIGLSVCRCTRVVNSGDMFDRGENEVWVLLVFLFFFHFLGRSFHENYIFAGCYIGCWTVFGVM